VKIEQPEYEARTGRLAAHLQEESLSGAVLFDAAYVL
jgi:hypothetical protein